MKRILTFLNILMFLLIPLTGFSIEFIRIDEKGNYYFTCEDSSGGAISVKIIEKNKYKVLAPFVGRIVHADSESEVALIVCGESGKTENKK